jgi:rod shape-determining protein MreC
MLQYFSRHSYSLTVVILLAVSIQLMSMSTKNPELAGFGWRIISRIIYPVQKLTHEVFETSDFLWNRYLWLQHVALERDILALQIKELREQNSILTELAHENERLRTLLHYSDMRSHKGVVASVIAKDPSNWLMTVTIDKGEKAGLYPGIPVVTGEGIVGQVVVVARNTSTVLLLNDTASSVAAMLQDNRSTGVIEGVFKKNDLALNYVENIQDEVIHIGERVITSGMDGIFPKGYLIGFVKSISDDENGLFRKIKVESAVNLQKLELVSVLVPESND